ncbi:MAG: hypothetical protein ABIV11_09280 [Gemmatimonadaceae bacterium]
MALHPSFPQSPYAELLPDQRWFPADLKPRDMIDLQSFMWVQGSDEYEE